MTPTQRELARHALGLPNDRMRSYRNSYFVGNRSPAHGEWLKMLERGLAEVEPGEPNDFFWLTRAGAEMALNEGERLDPEDFPS